MVPPAAQAVVFQSAAELGQQMGLYFFREGLKFHKGSFGLNTRLFFLRISQNVSQRAFVILNECEESQISKTSSEILSEFTLSQKPRSFASLRMTSEGLRTTSAGYGMTQQDFCETTTIYDTMVKKGRVSIQNQNGEDIS
jgi:hypothetical protein